MLTPRQARQFSRAYDTFAEILDHLADDAPSESLREIANNVCLVIGTWWEFWQSVLPGEQLMSEPARHELRWALESLDLDRLRRALARGLGEQGVYAKSEGVVEPGKPAD